MTDKIIDLEQKLSALAERGQETTERVDLLNELAGELSIADAERALDVAREAHKLATQLSYTRGIATSLGNIGFAEYLFSNHEVALQRLHEALAILKESGDDRSRGRTLSVIAAVHYSLGNFEQALASSFESLKIAREAGDKQSEGWLLNGIGGAYNDLGDHERALHHHRESLEIFGEIGHAVGRARSLNGIGTVYQGIGKYDEALEYHNQSLEIFVKEKNKLGEARALNDIGMVYQDLGEYDKALECHEKSLRLRDEVGNKQAKSTSLINLGKLYILMKDVDKALDVLHRALTLAMEIKAKPRIYQANLALSEAYSLREDYADALAHYKIYQQVKEEVAGDQASSRITNLQISFEVEKSEKEAEISRLKNVELKEKNDELERLLRELNEAQTQLVQSEKMAALGTLVAGVVHEINNPVGAINSVNDVSRRCVQTIVEELEKSATLDELKNSERFQRAVRTLRDDTDVARTASRRIAKIVDSLKVFTSLDEAALKEVDLNEGLESTITLIKHDFGDRIRVVREFGHIPRVTCNPGEMNQVFMHLLTNAKQAIEGEGTIKVRTLSQDGNVHIEISDTGVGIPKEHLARLFEPALSRKGARVRAGLGLFTSYKIIKKQRGDITVESEVGKGSTFKLTIPGGPARIS